MKILWFTNTPCSASEKLNPSIISGGWLSSLEKEINKVKGVDLHIAFYYSKEIEPFTYNGTHFYPIFRRFTDTKIQRYLARLFRLEYNDTTEIKQLCAVVELIKPDLIHIHGTEENFGLIQKCTTIPVVISIQGLLNPIRDKLYSGISKQIASKYRSLQSVLLVNSSRYTFRKFKRIQYVNLRYLKSVRILSVELIGTEGLQEHYLPKVVILQDRKCFDQYFIKTNGQRLNLMIQFKL